MAQSAIAAPSVSQFCFQIQALETNLLRAEPLHSNVETAELLFSLLNSQREVFHFLPIAPFTDVASFASQFLAPITADRTFQLYLLIAKNDSTFQFGTDTRSGQPAGLIAYLQSSADNSLTEIGAVIIFPEWQRTFVSTHAIGLLLKNALDPPEKGGLGLRRVEWRCHHNNAPSRRAAERMGFVFEGIMRWAMVLPYGKESNGRTVVDGAKPGRDTVLYSMTWEDWLVDGKRELVDRLMQRPAEQSKMRPEDSAKS